MEELYAGIIKVVLFLLGCLALVVIMKKQGLKFSQKGERAQENRSIKKLDTVHLGYRKFVSVLEIEGRILVVSVSDKEISLLAKWRKDERE